MFRDAIAKFFRSLNSTIVSTDPGLTRKFLKLTLLLSWRLSRIAPDGKSGSFTIENFDRSIRLLINPARSMGKVIYWTGFHEVKELIFLHHYLKPEMIFLDIGANMGEYSLFAAKRVTLGKVFAYEPLPFMNTLLKESLRLNDFRNMEILPYGLADRPGELTIFEVKDRHEGLATLYPGNRESNSKHTIELRTVDAEVARLKLERLDFIKIDIEGSELAALKGARETIARFKPLVLVEINKSTYEMAGYTPADVLNLFVSLGYKPWAFDREARLVDCPVMPVFGNIIFKAE